MTPAQEYRLGVRAEESSTEPQQPKIGEAKK